jgi:hypothetical protein
VRGIPLETVLPHWGAERDRRDKSQWRTPLGPLSVTGSKFFNWHQEAGGGGAIDLVMHLGGWDAAAAVKWLEQHFGGGPATPSIIATTAAHAPTNTSSTRSHSGREAAVPSRQQLRLPVPEPANLPRVHRYLLADRGLDGSLLQSLIDTGKVYADRRGNAVFLMVAGKAQRVVGAELRGTNRRVWRGLAPGTCRDAGYFWIGPACSERRAGCRRIVLCESAIDVISCFQLHLAQHATACICISTAGVRSDLRWLQPLLARGYDIHCGFDNDQPGEDASHRLIRRHPAIRRLRPPAHDWNEALLASR